MSFTALVLAGTRPGGDPLAKAERVEAKALIEIGGRPMLLRVVEALRAAGAARVAVACDEGAVAKLARSSGCEVIEPASGPSGSVARGLDFCGAPIVVTTADHALLEAEWVEALVERTPEEADLSVMLARRSRIEERLPGSRRTYLKFADGSWSGCNLFYLRTGKARAAIDIWQQIEADRKRPWRVVARLGLATLWSYARGRLTLAEGLAQLGRRIGVDAALVEAPDGLAAVDADKPGDLVDIRRILAEREAGPDAA